MSDFNGGNTLTPCTTCGWPVLEGNEWCSACGCSVDAEPASESEPVGHRGLGDPLEQSEHLERVSTRIAHAIVGFLGTVESDFHMQQLVIHVQALVPGTAPDSASRILRDLRLKNVIDYDVINRRQSHYRVRRGVAHVAR